MRLRRVFLDTDLRCAFEGLRKLAVEEKTALANTSVVFINRKMTAFKLLHNDSYLIYYKNWNRRMPIDALIHLPEHFGGSQLEVTSAIRKSLEIKLGRQNGN